MEKGERCRRLRARGYREGRQMKETEGEGIQRGETE
jgi:hypothetical protein